MKHVTVPPSILTRARVPFLSRLWWCGCQLCSNEDLGQLQFALRQGLAKKVVILVTLKSESVDWLVKLCQAFFQSSFLEIQQVIAIANSQKIRLDHLDRNSWFRFMYMHINMCAYICKYTVCIYQLKKGLNVGFAWWEKMVIVVNRKCILLMELSY